MERADALDGERAPGDDERVSDLAQRLALFDGRDTAVLEEIRDEVRPDRAPLREVIDLADCEEGRVAAGATWLLRAWLEAGAPCAAALVGRLAKRLPAIADPWARQHVCQCLGSLAVTATAAPAFAGFLREAAASERPFLRAWAIDGMFRLALRHEGFHTEADALVAEGLADPKASVRARCRRIAAEAGRSI